MLGCRMTEGQGVGWLRVGVYTENGRHSLLKKCIFTPWTWSVTYYYICLELIFGNPLEPLSHTPTPCLKVETLHIGLRWEKSGNGDRFSNTNIPPHPIPWQISRHALCRVSSPLHFWNGSYAPACVSGKIIIRPHLFENNFKIFIFRCTYDQWRESIY